MLKLLPKLSLVLLSLCRHLAVATDARCANGQTANRSTMWDMLCRPLATFCAWSPGQRLINSRASGMESRVWMGATKESRPKRAGQREDAVSIVTGNNDVCASGGLIKPILFICLFVAVVVVSTLTRPYRHRPRHTVESTVDSCDSQVASMYVFVCNATTDNWQLTSATTNNLRPTNSNWQQSIDMAIMMQIRLAHHYYYYSMVMSSLCNTCGKWLVVGPERLLRLTQHKAGYNIATREAMLSLMWWLIERRQGLLMNAEFHSWSGAISYLVNKQQWSFILFKLTQSAPISFVLRSWWFESFGFDCLEFSLGIYSVVFVRVNIEIWMACWKCIAPGWSIIMWGWQQTLRIQVVDGSINL